MSTVYGIFALYFIMIYTLGFIFTAVKIWRIAVKKSFFFMLLAILFWPGFMACIFLDQKLENLKEN